MSNLLLPCLRYTSSSMENLDRLEWKAGICCTAYGLRLGVRVDQPSVLDRVAQALPVGSRPARSLFVDRLYSLILGGVESGLASGCGGFSLHANSVPLVQGVGLDDALERLETDLQLHVAERARRRVFIHAGVVGWRGRAVVLPGRTFTGKSTLVAALVRAGASYYSDEYAVLDGAGQVHPYPRHLSLREGGSCRPRRLPPEALGGPVGMGPLPVGLVVASRYEPGARWRPRALTPGRALLELLANAVPARHKPRVVLSTLKRVVLEAPAVKGLRGEAQEIVEPVLRLLAASRAVAVVGSLRGSGG